MLMNIALYVIFPHFINVDDKSCLLYNISYFINERKKEKVNVAGFCKSELRKPENMVVQKILYTLEH